MSPGLARTWPTSGVALSRTLSSGWAIGSDHATEHRRSDGQRPGQAPTTRHCASVPQAASQVLELQRSVGNRAVGAALRNAYSRGPNGSRAPRARALQRTFKLFSNYKPKSDEVKAYLLPDETPQAIKEETLDSSREYYVAGFNLSGQTVLEDKQLGYKFLIGSDADVQFERMSDDPRFSFVGFSDSDAQQWEAQKFERSCWAAATVVLAGKTQGQVKNDLHWPDEALYSIGWKEVPEFAQMIGLRLKPVLDYANPDVVRAALQSSSAPLILSVPSHIVLLYAITPDGDVKLWDPRGPRLLTKKWAQYRQHVDGCMCKA